jgi:hypothetical protein
MRSINPIENIRPGDLIAVSGRGFVSGMIQLGTLSLPNTLGLGRRGWAGVSHVAIASPVFGEMLLYESTSFARPPCVRTGRIDPVGVQTHYIDEITQAGGDVWHYPLKRQLYFHEEDRLCMVLESCLGRSYDYFGAARSGGKLNAMIQFLVRPENFSLLYCSELVAFAWNQVGIFGTRNASVWSPNALLRRALRTGLVQPGILLST